MSQSQDMLERTKQWQIDVEEKTAMIGLTPGSAQGKAAIEAVRFAKENLDGQQKRLRLVLATPYDVVVAAARPVLGATCGSAGPGFLMRKLKSITTRLWA